VSAAAWESLHKAALELAKPSPLKQRLIDAFTRHLLDLPPYEVPGDLRQDFEALRLSMTRIRPSPGESPVMATVRKMSIGEADACAARIVGLLDLMHRNALTAPPSKAGSQGRSGLTDTSIARIPTLISVNRA